MKKCSYCGKQYADDVSVCPIDNEPMSESVSTLAADRLKVTGVWRGVYSYGPWGERAGLPPVAFTLKLKQGWTAHFTGSVTEDGPRGTPGTGAVDGYFKSPKMEFQKQMPVGYILQPDGTRLSLRDFFLAKGRPCENELPASPIFYQGTLIDSHRVQGTWIIRPRKIQLADGASFGTLQQTGFWRAEWVAEDAPFDPLHDSTDPWFDKTLLSPRELEEVGGLVFCGLGKFAVMDAEKFLDRFTRENIRFELRRNDDALREMTPFAQVTGGYAGMAPTVELFVHPEDQAKAMEIVNADNKV
jgi:hypothetical protein